MPSLKQNVLREEAKSPKAPKNTRQGKSADNIVDVTASADKASAAADDDDDAQHKPRRIPRPRPQHATPLDTTDDDEYDDCWLATYEDPHPSDLVVEEDWVRVKKPDSGR
ncbi:hypothetical protein CTA2_9063 [Colletotrichum tanaceti]|uniref:Uncharacterized protein n=1 Tax=Colletotrichum tanaceti TaxID=1306861 RepID=A0A4U6XGE0_9PEZI|nr:hypothetical protein CTA2_9063 [Colletotrichum tanaceti]TKW54654.1 hypothetical protein CTA1_10788 [Colletotrichum tanaceti]